MRILYIASELNWCGASISFLTLLKGMKSHGVEMLVVAPNNTLASCKFVKELVAINVPYIQIPLPWDIKSLDKNVITLRQCLYSVLRKISMMLLRSKRQQPTERETSKKYLRNIIKEFAPDIVHTNVGVIHEAFEVCQELDIPHVWHLRDYHDLDFHWMPLPNWEVYKQQLRKSTAVITITDDIRRHYGLWDSPNTRTIYNGCFDKNDVTIVSPKDKFFLSASRLVEAKGHIDTVKAFELFYRTHQDYQLILAGMGEDGYINKLNNLIDSLSCKNAIKIIGHQDDVRPLMRKARALIVSSYNEGFGRMTAEAASCGCLVIGRNTGGTKEILDQTGGFLFDKGNAIRGIANNMEKLAILPDAQYKKMAEIAQSKAVDLYSNESYIEHIFAVYLDILEKR